MPQKHRWFLLTSSWHRDLKTLVWSSAMGWDLEAQFDPSLVQFAIDLVIKSSLYLGYLEPDMSHSLFMFGPVVWRWTEEFRCNLMVLHLCLLSYLLTFFLLSLSNSNNFFPWCAKAHDCSYQLEETSYKPPRTRSSLRRISRAPGIWGPAGCLSLSRLQHHCCASAKLCIWMGLRAQQCGHGGRCKEEEVVRVAILPVMFFF